MQIDASEEEERKKEGEEKNKRVHYGWGYIWKRGAGSWLVTDTIL